MRGRSPVTVWRPPARAHTLAHTQSNCRVDGSAAWALRAVQRRVGTSRIAFYNPCFRLHGCVLRDRGPRRRPGTGVLRSCRCRPRGAREAYNAGERTALRAASAAAPPDATNFADCAFFARFPAFPVLRLSNRPTWTSARPTPRTRKASLRLVARRAAVRQPARSPGSGVFGSTLGSPTGVSLSPSRFTTGDHEQ